MSRWASGFRSKPGADGVQGSAGQVTLPLEKPTHGLYRPGVYRSIRLDQTPGEEASTKRIVLRFRQDAHLYGILNPRQL
jgi:hypothetical protein